MTPLPSRPVLKEDVPTTFDCGVSALNDWLNTRAIANEKAGDSRTYVVVDSETNQIVGYYALSASALERTTITGKLARNAPNPIPVVLLGRLAVDLSARGLGLGRDLLADALHRAQAGAAIIGARALVTEAKDVEAADFYRHNGLTPLPTSPLTLYIPLRLH